MIVDDKKLELKAQNFARGIEELMTHGLNPTGFKHACNFLHDAGYHLTAADEKALADNLSGSFSAPQGTTQVGLTRSQISNAIVRSYMPEVDMSAHPLISMFPILQVNANQLQQNQIGAGYGMAQPANVLGGAQQQVQMLSRYGKIWKGSPIMAETSLNGTEANEMKAMFSANLNENGALEMCNYQLQLLYAMTANGIVGRTFDAIKKGSYKAMPPTTEGGNYVYASIDRGNQYIYQSSESLATYHRLTNVFTPNTLYVGNVFNELTAALNAIKTTGYECEAIIMDNFIWSAMMSTPSAQAKLAYASFSSDNDIAGIQRNLFKTTMIPTLQNIPILVYDQGYKFAPGEAGPDKSRPLWWGEDVTSASFRIMFKLRSPLSSIFGNTAFYSDVINDGMFSTNNGGTTIGLRMIDTTQYDPANPSIKMWARSNWGLTYNNQAGFLAFFDPQVVVTD